MTFYEMLEQVMALLQRHGRLSYRALTVQFELDDDRLDLLKEELIDIQHIARDQDGRMLVWTGGTEIPPPASASASPPPAQQVITQQDLSTHVASPPTAPHTHEAERRQLTVMFCDVVDSTALSGQLDPEEYRDVVRAYQTACTEVIRRYDGHIAQLLGDGLLVYFGYPQAHEDDAQRAVRTGLGILDAMGDLHKRLEQEKGITLALRLGIHTGIVVVGAMGGGGRQEQLALGETPNIASRIQGLAAPNTLVVSGATYRLIQGYFACQDLGEQTLRGVAESITMYQILRESGATSRLDIVQPRGLTPLVGREQEVGLLVERWEQVKAGQGHVVLLTGDAGIGKSRLVQMIKDHVANEPHTRWECRSVPYYQNTALYPLTDLFQRLVQFQTEDTSDAKLEKLEQMLSQYRLPLEETVPLFAPLLALPLPEHHYPPLNLSPQRQRQKTLETIVAILLELAERQPVLFIVEDLHWTDPTTLELLNLVLDQTPTASMLVLLTCRPHFQPSWTHRSFLSEITINRLSPTQVGQIVHRLTDGKTFPAEVLQQMLTKTDGVPLFIEELTKAILESGHLTEADGHYALTGSLSMFVIPATLQDSLMARLDRLMTAKVIAQLGATIGRQFSYALLQAVAQLDEVMLQHELSRLVEAEIIYHRGVPPQATYTFKHALIQDAAYESLLKSTRQHYHQQIAQVLEAQFPETAEAEPELLAQHYTEAGLTEQAVAYWQRAGQQAVERSAYAEAVSHLTTALDLLTTLPESRERSQQELAVQMTLGMVLVATKGFAAPEVAHAYTRAHALCREVGDTPQLISVLSGLYGFHVVRAEFQTAQELAEQYLTLAHSLQDPTLLGVAHRVLGQTTFWRGELVPARAHLQQSITLYNPEQRRSQAVSMGQDPGVTGGAWLALTLWLLGSPDQARQRSHEALTLAQELSHPFTLVVALTLSAWLHHFLYERHAAQEQSEAAIRLATEQGFAHWVAWGTILRGAALAEQGQRAEGLAQIRQGLDAYRATGGEAARPYWLAQLAEACQKAGQPEEGLTLLTEALATAHKTGEGWWEAEIYRLRGELLSQHAVAQPGEAETWLQRALAVARRQEAKSLELRAAMSLARLWQQQGKHAEAYDLLAPIYGWFTEGFDTADLQEAKVLLEALK